MQREINKFLKKLSVEKLKNNHKECIELYNIIGGMYSEIGSYDEAVHYHVQALEMCKTVGDRVGTATAHRFIGEAKASSGQFHSAIETTKKYLELAQRLNDKVEIQRAWTTLGRVFLMYAQDLKDQNNRVTNKIKEVAVEAEKRFVQALKMAESVRDQIDPKEYAQMISGLQTNIGLVNDIGGMRNEAIARLNKAIEICKANKLKEDLYRCQAILSSIFRTQDSLRLANKTSEDALTTAKSIGKKIYICDAYIEKGLVKVIQRDFKGAKRAFAQAYLEKSPSEEDHAKAIKLTKIAHMISNTFEKLSQDKHLSAEKRMKICDKLGDLFVSIGTYKLAIEYYRRALSDAKACGRPKSELAKILFSIAETYADDGQYEHALICFEKELTYRTGNSYEQCQSLVKIAHTLEYLGRDPDKVCETYEKALDIAGRDTKLMYVVLKDYIPFMQAKSFNLTRCSELEALMLNLKSYPEVLEVMENEGNEEVSDLEDEIANIDDIITDDEGNDEVLMVGRRRTKGPNKYKTNEVGDTPLHEACIKGDLKRVKSLIEQGHAVNPRDHAGWIPLHEAANHGHASIVEYLIECGADVNYRGPDGVTPLHDAAVNGHFEIMNLLIRGGANVIALTDAGETVLGLLRSYKREFGEKLTNHEMSEYKSMEVELLNAMDKCGFNLMTENIKNMGNKSNQTSTAFQTKSLKTNNLRSSLDAESNSGTVKEYRDTIKVLKRRRIQDDRTSAPQRAHLPAMVNADLSTSAPTKDWLIDDVSREKKVEQRRRPMVLEVLDSESENECETDENLESVMGKSNERSEASRSRARRQLKSLANNKKSLLESDDSNGEDGLIRLDDPIRLSPESNPKDDDIIMLQNDEISNTAMSNDLPVAMSPASCSWSLASNSCHAKVFNLLSRPLVVEIEEKKLMIPIKDENMTIETLKSSIVERYSVIVKAKPKINLGPKSDPSCYFYDGDLCKDVIREDVIAKIESWQLKSAETTYEETCRAENVDALLFIKLELRGIDETGEELDLSYTRFPRGHVSRLLPALCYRNFRDVNLTGSTSFFDCSKTANEMLDCIDSWRNLTRLTLRCVGLRSEHFTKICSKLASKELITLDISYNGISYKSHNEFNSDLARLKLNCPKLNELDMRNNRLEFLKFVSHQRVENLSIKL